MGSAGGPRPTIAFDWNGTLADDLPRAAAATDTVLGSFALPEIGPERFAAAFRLPLRAFFRELGVPVPDLPAAEAAWNAAMAAGTATAATGARELLEAARDRGFRIVVVSAADPDVVRADARKLGLLDHLDAVVGAADPKSAALADLVTGSGGAAVLYVGDTEYDVTEALQAGATAVGYSGGYRPAAALTAAGAAVVVGDLRDVVPLLRSGVPRRGRPRGTRREGQPEVAEPAGKASSSMNRSLKSGRSESST